MERYETLKKIGKGAFGTAYLVRERGGARRELVLKSLPCEGHDATKIKDARNEARLLASTRHPNVLPLVDAFRDKTHAPPRYCIVTQLARGGDLARAIARRKQRREPWTEPELLGMLVQARGVVAFFLSFFLSSFLSFFLSFDCVPSSSSSPLSEAAPAMRSLADAWRRRLLSFVRLCVVVVVVDFL